MDFLRIEVEWKVAKRLSSKAPVMLGKYQKRRKSGKRGKSGKSGNGGRNGGFHHLECHFAPGKVFRDLGFSQRVSQNHELSLGNRFWEIMPLLLFSLYSGKCVEVCATAKPDPRDLAILFESEKEKKMKLRKRNKASI